MTQTTFQPTASPRRRWLQFRLSTLLLFTAGLSVWLAFYFSSAKRGERAVESLQESGVEVMFDYQRRTDDSVYSHQVEPPGPSAVRYVVGDGFFQNAEWIRLHDTRIAADVLKPLVQLPSVRRVTLTNCGIGDKHMVHLSKMRLLELLDLKTNQITDKGLFELQGMVQLETLSMTENEIQGHGLRHLGDLGKLRQLFLHDNPITDENLAHIGTLSNLEMLGLAGTNVTDDGLIHFVNLKNLVYLGLTRTNVTADAIRELQKQLPNCEIEQ